MLPVILTFLRSYAPYVTLPVAAVIGFVGYHMENILSDKYTPYQKGSIKDRRVERLVDENLEKDATKVETLKEKKFVPQTVFEKNVSPSLVDKS